MKTIRMISLAAIAAMTVLSACQKEPVIDETPDIDQPNAEGEWTLTIQASKGADTKALELDGSSLNAYWKDGEKVDAYLNGTLLGTLTATPKEAKSTTATLTMTLTDVTGLTENSQLTLIFPGREDHLWDYTGQDGSAPTESGSLATRYDFATAVVEIASISGSEITTKAAASFTNQQSMYRFGFRKDSASGNYFDPKTFTISTSVEAGHLVKTVSYDNGAWQSSAWGSLTVTPAATGDHFYYLSIRNDNTSAAETYHFSAVDDNNALRMGSKVVPAEKLGAGKFISMKNIAMPLADFQPASGEITSSSEVL